MSRWLALGGALALPLALSIEPGGPGGDGARPETPTFSGEVAEIVHRRCGACHHDGGSGPFPLLEYRDVSKRARQLRQVVSRRQMPPWPPVPGHGEFTEPRRLTDEELETLLAWFDGGTPLGNAEEVPPPPTYSDDWELGPPDLVLTMDRSYVVPAEGFDVWRTFVVPTGFERDTYVEAVEFRPTNERVVHHFIMYMDASGESRRRDLADPEAGFEGMTAEVSLLGDEAYGWVPGMSPARLPDGVATRVGAGTDFVLDTHFVPTGKPEDVAIEVGLHLAEAPTEAFPTGVILVGPGATIPPGVSDYTIGEHYVLPTDVRLMTIAPHAHYVCKRVHVWADLPDGERVELLLIEDWDPNWQEIYRYADQRLLPKGTRIEMRFTYDNSADNPRNPYVPPHRIVTGKASYNEMAVTWINVIVENDEALRELQAYGLPKYRADVVRATRLLDIWKSLVATFDTNGDDSLDPEEDARATAYVNGIWDNRPHLLGGFDANGDGEIDDEERAFVELVIRNWNGEPAR